jgi:hypothetical protein
VKKSIRTQEQRRRRKAAAPYLRAVKWAAGLALAAGVAYVIAENAGVPFDEKAIAVVNFSDLSPKGRKAALKAANEARCTCGCGLGLAECVATDKTCPVRDDDIERIKAMVRDASSL